jgi:hypothetical protein
MLGPLRMLLRKTLDASIQWANNISMTGETSTDPMAMFRQMVNQWEKMTNEYGGKMLGTSEFAQGMQGATAISMQIQQAVHESMTKVLAVTNMPSRDDLAALGSRVANMEAQLSRIEAAIGATPKRDVPKPKRTKQPPAKAK